MGREEQLTEHAKALRQAATDVNTAETKLRERRDERWNLAIAANVDGMTVNRIAELLGVSRYTVTEHLQQLRRTDG